MTHHEAAKAIAHHSQHGISRIGRGHRAASLPAHTARAQAHNPRHRRCAASPQRYAGAQRPPLTLRDQAATTHNGATSKRDAYWFA
jgi:hypothetical protein